MTQLSVQHIRKSYANDTHVLNELSFELGAGERMSILGESGCGKSTLLRIIAGLESIQAGRVSLDEIPYVTPKKITTPNNIGFVFQNGALFPHMTIEKNIAFGLAKHQPKKDIVEDMLALIKLSGFEKRYPHELSGGQRQRVALARSLARKPSVLLLDEPFSGLDEQTRHTIRDELISILNQASIASLFVTHHQDDAHVFSENRYTIMNGRLERRE